MAVLNLKRLFGTGGSDLTPQGAGNPSLLRKILAALVNASGAAAVPAWSTGVAVAAHTVTLSSAGYVFAVEATTATAAGPKALVQNGTPGAGEVNVAYDASGVATLTFNAADAVTACAVQKLAFGDSVSIEA